MRKIIFLIFAAALCLSLCGCDRYFYELKLENLPQKVEHFDFEGYDTINVTLSEDEYIVLCAEEDFTWTYEENGAVWHGGSGQWVKGEAVTDIWFEETPQGDWLASFGGYAYRGFLIYVDGGSEEPVAMVISNVQEPAIRYYSETNEVSAEPWTEPVKVKAETYMR